MKGIQLTEGGAELKLVDGIEKPSPGPGQVLVKSIATAINPVDTIMQSTGMLVLDWPIVLGCDSGGIVEELGPNVKKFKPGDHVLGCSRLGKKGHATFQEYHLMDERLAIKAPPNLSLEQACTMGVGTYTASLALLEGLALHLPLVPAPLIDEWVIILGGGGSVGGYAIQIAKICGYKVLASASGKSAETALSVGADAVFDYRQDEATQLAKISEVTGGFFRRIFDSVGQKPDLPFKALTDLSKLSPKLYSTTDDFTEMKAPQDVGLYRCELALIGRSGKEIEPTPNINQAIEAFVPKLEHHIKTRAIKPQKLEVIGKPGIESILEAFQAQKAGKSGGSKLVARVAE